MSEAIAAAQTNEKLSIRRLNTKDFWTVLSVLRKGGKEALSRMGAAEEMDNMARGILIMDIGLEYAEKDLKGLLADLAGMSLEEYEKQPFETTIDIIEVVSEQEDLSAFFKRVAGLFKKVSPTE